MVPDIAEYLSRVMNDRKFLESALENKENKILFSKIFRTALY